MNNLSNTLFLILTHALEPQWSMLHTMLEDLLESAPHRVWESYCANPNPTPLEDRFASRALHQLGRFTQAKNLAIHAQTRGEVAAIIEETRAAIDLGEIEWAIAQLEKTKTDHWSNLDKLFYARELGTFYALIGHQKTITWLEEAWKYSFIDEDCKFFRTSIAQSLGIH